MRLHRTHAPTRRPRWRAAVLPSAAVVMATAWISGCSVLYDLSTEQCSTDADCDALGGTFVGLACVEHLCATPPGCNSNAECIDTVGNGGEPYACIDRSCVQLRTTECPTMLPQTDDGWLDALRDDDPVIVAGTGVLGNNNFDPFFKNYDLALTELNRNPGGVDGGRRPLVMLGCGAIFDSRDELDAMMTHVSQAVKVKGMIMSLYAEDLQYAFQNYAQPANMFFLSAFESDPALAEQSDSGLLWHVGPRPEVMARVYAPLLTRVIAHLGLTGTVRVATVLSDDLRFSVNMGTTITAGTDAYGLSFNGTSVVDNLTAGNYLGLTTKIGEASSVEQIQQLIDFKPHVIISAAGPEFYRNIITGVDAGWNPGDGQPKPFYILSPINYNDLSSLNIALTASPTLQRRLAGVNGAAAEDPANYNAYLLAYNQQFHVTETGYENFYDAAYYLMYAAGAVAASSPLSGDDFARGMRRLLGGSQTFNVGQTQLPAGLAAVERGTSIELDGTLGPPIWNENGTRDLPGSVYCIDTTGSFKADVLRYREATPGDASTVSLDGDFTCIPGF